ncbi:MAG: DNA repair protein RecN [Salinivirgaceae bacterium]|jgi:DNA repair protein RecN (Recombination protein N)|nr:DNA repair protein RecN [Salinivirgaceae bacterium]
MLKNLKVQNYALIQNLDIEFNGDFSTLTGETGAGKSILLGALSLVLGVRADLSALQNNEKKCIVEAVFDIKNYRLEGFFKENDLDYETEALIRREINTSGKSRAFVNDTPVNLNMLKQLATRLIDVHSQHESLALNNSHFQLQVIDSVAQNTALLSDYKKVYTAFKVLKKELLEIQEHAKTASADFDYNLFQFNQLSDLRLNEINVIELENELKMLNNAEEIQQNLALCFAILSEDEINSIEQIKVVKLALLKIQAFFPKAEGFIERLESISIELKDIAQEAELSAEQMEFNPVRAEEIKEKLDGVYSVMQKHKVATLPELVEITNQFKQKVDKYSNIDADIRIIEKKLSDATNDLDKLGQQLSKKRKNATKPFIKKIISQLEELGMPYASFQVLVETNSHFHSDGIDTVNFLFSANKNQPEQSIAKIASGGEISRLMLSIKAILSESVALPTIIFDEIDTGVSGEIAHKMANIMTQMAKNMQVISITHLPQIAAKGKNHYKVFKKEDAKSVQTKIVHLSNRERIDEIARLLSGTEISKEAVENAKSLIQS